MKADAPCDVSASRVRGRRFSGLDILAIAVVGAFQTRAHIATHVPMQRSASKLRSSHSKISCRLQIDEENSLARLLADARSVLRPINTNAVAEFDANVAVDSRSTSLAASDLADRVASRNTMRVQNSGARKSPLRCFAIRANVPEIDMRNKLFSDYEIANGSRAAFARSRRQRRTGAQHASAARSHRRTFVPFGCCSSDCWRFCSMRFVRASTANSKKSAPRRERCSEPFGANRFRFRTARSAAPIWSATSHSAVGGDVFDVLSAFRPLCACRSSPTSAAKASMPRYLTAFIKFTIRGIVAAPHAIRGAILAEFNDSFARP